MDTVRKKLRKKFADVDVAWCNCVMRLRHAVSQYCENVRNVRRQRMKMGICEDVPKPVSTGSP